ncbi:hypothetical protein L7F22_056257 [Adiantum nelumboides]|nr:hypothetical protein [Adiantum nelumboides]
MSGPVRAYPGAWHAVADFLVAAGVDTVFAQRRVRRDRVRAAERSARGARRGQGPRRDERAHRAARGVVLGRAGAGPRLRDRGARPGDRGVPGARPALGGPATRRLGGAGRPPRPGTGAVEHAWTAAVAGRPGPVYLELPDHLGTAPVERTLPWSSPAEVSTAFRFERDSAAVAALRAARRPVLLVGGGARHRNADRRVERLADRTGAAVFTTASGRGTVDEAHPRFLGLSGLYLRPAAEKVWHDADLVVALGSRLEETAVFGAGVPTVLQVNIDAGDLSASFPGPRIVGDVGAVVAALDEAAGGAAVEREWGERVDAARAELDAEARTAAGPGGPPVARLLAALDRALPTDRVLVQENGLTDMWSYLFPYLPCRAGAGSIVPSEQTSLGFGAAAATGVAIAAPGRRVVAFVGDGAFALTSADLVTGHRERTGVLYVVLCNGGYGWLQSQADQRGLERDRFGFVTDAGPPPVPADPTVHRATLDPRGDAAPVLAAALAACAQGRTAVLYVPVDLTDAPPGLSEVDGDFPAPRSEGDHDRTPGNGEHV